MPGDSLLAAAKPENDFMSVLHIALPIALVVSLAFVAAFVWQVRTGQLDDLETPPRRVLFDDDMLPSRSGDSSKPV